MASSVDNIISMFQQRAMQNAYKNAGARNIGVGNFKEVLNKSISNDVNNSFATKYNDSYSRNFNPLNSSYHSSVGSNTVSNKYARMQSVLSASDINNLNTLDKFSLESEKKIKPKAFLNTVSSKAHELAPTSSGHIKPVRKAENVFGVKSIGEEISSGISKQIHNIKASESKINHLSEVEDIDSMDFVTNVHNLELQVKQFNLVMNKIVEVLKSLLYNTQL